MSRAETFILDGIWGRCERWGRLRRRLAGAVGPCEIYPYDNSGQTSLEKAGAVLAGFLERRRCAIHLVGYSMGSLVIREALRQNPALPLQRAAFLHSPHRGSLAAWLRPDLPACREMRPGSTFLRRLEESDWMHPTLVTWSAGDLMVLPGDSARWGKASLTLRSPVPAHAWPVISPGIHKAVAGFLAGAENVTEVDSRTRALPASAR